MEQVASFTTPIKKGISHLAFSPDGKYLAALGFDVDHTVAVFDWNAKGKKTKRGDPRLIAQGGGPKAAVLGLLFDNTST